MRRVKLHLASEDRHVHSLCQEVLGEVVGRGWTLHVAKDLAAECNADLYVWDLDDHTSTALRIDARDKWRHFFLVERANTAELCRSLAFTDAHILLKPLTKATLLAFFSDACRRCMESPVMTEEGIIASLRSDRDEILQFLMQANLRLQEYDHDRTNFLARAIHDFRAPLTAVTGYCGLLLGEELGSLTAQQCEVIERMYRSARKLSRMASAMFQLSVAPRIEVALDLKANDIRDCIDHAMNEIMPLTDEKRILIEVDCIRPPGDLVFEAMRLEQVLVNLLDNACKFTPRSGKILIRAYPYFWERRVAGRTGVGSGADRRLQDDQTPNSYRIDICDSGPGVPPAHLPRIFEEYTCYGGGIDRSGGGLGLAICRMIIQQHKGHIWAENTGSGTVFSLVLPVERMHSSISGQTAPAAEIAM
jgi:signal transduction histidine kinase